MTVYVLPDGRLVVPRCAEGPGGLLGDAMQVIGPENPDHREWLTYFRQSGRKPVPVAEWPPKRG